MSFISKRYAQALFELALEQNCLDKVLQDLSLIQNLLNTIPEFKKFVNSAYITQSQFQKFFDTFSKTMEFSGITINFLDLIGSKKRQNYLISMIDAFINLVQNYESKAKVYIRSTRPLSLEQRHLLIKTLEQQFNKTMLLDETIDPTLISGVVIDFEGFRIDTSLKTQLAQWQNELRV